MRHVLATELGASGDKINLEVDDRGKPFLAGEAPADVSIAHDRRHVCVAWNPRGRVGVDVQRYSAGMENVARRFFTPQEQGLVEELPHVQRWSALSSLWATKEAVCKARGTGLGFPLPALDALAHTGSVGDLRYVVTSLDVRTAVAVAWDEHGVAARSLLDEPLVVEVDYADVTGNPDGYAR